MRITPSSSGWRSESSTSGANSPSSSRKSTPPVDKRDLAGAEPPRTATDHGDRARAVVGRAQRWAPHQAPRERKARRPSAPGWRRGPGRRRGRATGREGAGPASSCPRRADRPSGGGDRRRRRPRARCGPTDGPRTSARSGAGGCGGSDGRVGGDAATAPRPSAPRPSAAGRVRSAPGAGPPARPRTPSRAAPRPPRRARASTSDRAPGTCRRVPSRPSSPTNARSPTASAGTWPLATSTPTAMARSRAEPILRTEVGARFTVVRLSGHEKPDGEQGGADAVARLTARGVGEPDDGEARAGRGPRGPRPRPGSRRPREGGGRDGGEHGLRPPAGYGTGVPEQ